MDTEAMFIVASAFQRMQKPLEVIQNESINVNATKYCSSEGILIKVVHPLRPRPLMGSCKDQGAEKPFRSIPLCGANLKLTIPRGSF